MGASLALAPWEQDTYTLGFTEPMFYLIGEETVIFFFKKKRILESGKHWANKVPLSSGGRWGRLGGHCEWMVTEEVTIE